MSQVEVAAGSVFYEIEVMLASDSGRDKHTDLDEQGAWLALPILAALRSQNLQGAAFGRLRYWGGSCQPTLESPISEEEVGGYREPVDAARLRRLRDLIRDLSAVVQGQAVPDQNLAQVIEWGLGVRDWTEVADPETRVALSDGF